MDSAKVLTDGAKPLEPITDMKAAVPIGVTETKKEVITADSIMLLICSQVCSDLFSTLILPYRSLMHLTWKLWRMPLIH